MRNTKQMLDNSMNGPVPPEWTSDPTPRTLTPFLHHPVTV